jgi:hypothetical protein
VALPLSISGLHDYYEAKRRAQLTSKVLRFMALDRSQPVKHLFADAPHARTPAACAVDHLGNVGGPQRHLAGTARLARERSHWKTASTNFFEWIKIQSHQFRGVTFGTMLRDEAYQLHPPRHLLRTRRQHGTTFSTSSTTRCCPALPRVGGAVDYYQWSALLRSVSALELLPRIYRDQITPNASPNC